MDGPTLRRTAEHAQFLDQDDPTPIVEFQIGVVPFATAEGTQSSPSGAGTRAKSTTSIAVPEVAGSRAHDRSALTKQSLALGLVQLARPRQWIKNLLVFVAPGAAGVLLHWNVLWHIGAAFGVFCLAASGGYFINDAVGVEADRIHPLKRLRPVAAGVVPVGLAITAGAMMLTSAVCLGALLAGREMAMVMAIYAAVNVGYSLGLKNEAILDLALVSAGFVLRAIAGGVATGVVLSQWFIIVASFGSLLIVTGKRSGEKLLLSENEIDHGSVRRTLGLYTPESLRSIRTLSAAVTVTAYCLWAFERVSQVHNAGHPIWFQLSIVPFVIALLYVLRLIDSGSGAAPEDLAIRDHRLQICRLCWLALFVVATYA